MKGTGVAAALDRIRQAFREVHGDVRDKTQVEADRELMAEIASEQQIVEEVQVEEVRIARADSIRIDQTAQPDNNDRTARIADALIRSAIRGPHIGTHHILRRDSHSCYEIDVPVENASELFTQALRQLEAE